MAEIRLIVVDSTSDLANKIGQSIASDINASISTILSTNVIEQGLEKIITNAIEVSPEYESLLNGQLQKEFGLKEAKTSLDSIINGIIREMDIEFRPFTFIGNSFIGSLTISISKSDFSDVLNVDGASYISKNGIIVPWLNWLLLYGDNIVIGDYKIQYKDNDEVFMVKSNEGWRVPPEFSGTESDNWITRSLSVVPEELEKFIYSEILRRL